MDGVGKIRVLYADTDQMGQAYYGNFMKWFEAGRAEWFRSKGITYREVEEKGYYLPVVEAYCRYLQPAYYDDILELITEVSMVSGARIRFDYKVCKNGSAKIIAEGYTIHVFLSASSKKPVKPPSFVKTLITNKEPGSEVSI